LDQEVERPITTVSLDVLLAPEHGGHVAARVEPLADPMLEAANLGIGRIPAIERRLGLGLVAAEDLGDQRRAGAGEDREIDSLALGAADPERVGGSLMRIGAGTA